MQLHIFTYLSLSLSLSLTHKRRVNPRCMATVLPKSCVLLVKKKNDVTSCHENKYIKRCVEKNVICGQLALKALGSPRFEGYRIINGVKLLSGLLVCLTDMTHRTLALRNKPCGPRLQEKRRIFFSHWCSTKLDVVYRGIWTFLAKRCNVRGSGCVFFF